MAKKKDTNYTIFHKTLESYLECIVTPEYKFLENRKFRFDFAIPSKKIAIEIEGGVFSGGRHTRGVGYINDMEKYNLAAVNGWAVLRFTPEQTKKLETFELIKQLWNRLSPNITN